MSAVNGEGTLTGFHIPCHVWRAYSEHTWTRGPRAAVYSPLDILQHRKQLLQLPTAQQLSHPAAVTTNGQDPFVIKRALMAERATRYCEYCTHRFKTDVDRAQRKLQQGPRQGIQADAPGPAAPLAPHAQADGVVGLLTEA